MMNTRKSTVLVLLIPILFLSTPVLAQVDLIFQQNEVLVSDPSLSNIADPEYDSLLSRFCWIDSEGRLWLGNVDKTTGLLEPPDGRGELIDVDALGVRNLGNGCEWVYTDHGPEIVI